MISQQAPRRLAAAPSSRSRPVGPPAQKYRWIHEHSTLPYPLRHAIETRSVSRVAPASKATWSDDQLLRHWVNAAHNVIPHGEVDKELWKVEVPQLAAANPMLMEFLLAIASFHQAHELHGSSDNAHSRSERCKMHAVRGFRHHQLGVELLRDDLANVNQENARACFFGSILIVISSYADCLIRNLTQDGNQEYRMLDDLILIYSLSRGIIFIRDTYEIIPRPNGGERVLDVSGEVPQGQGGPLAPMLDLLTECISHLREVQDEPATEICLDTANLLRDLVRKAQASPWPPAHRALLQWLCLASEDFFHLLRARHPAALVVVSYSCIVGSYGIASCIGEGWAEVVPQEVLKVVDDKWKKAVAVPIRSRLER